MITMMISANYSIATLY